MVKYLFLNLIIFNCYLCAQHKFDLIRTDFIGVQEISGVLHYVVKNQCRKNEGTFMESIGSSLKVLSYKQKTKKDFKGCEYKLKDNDLYLLEGLGAEDMFISHSSLIKTDFGKKLSRLMLDWKYNFFSEALAPYDSIITSSMRIEYFFICNRKILMFEINNSDFKRMFDYLFTGEIKVISDSSNVKVGMLFNNKSDFLDQINELLESK